METKTAVKALSALAQETRLEVFRLVIRAGADGMAAGAIAEALQVPPATLSFHLKELVNTGLLVDRREGRSIFYSPSVDDISRLIGFLIDDCCQGNPAMCAPGRKLSPKPKAEN